MIDTAKTGGIYGMKPQQIYIKVYKYENCVVNKWEDLFELKYDKNDFDKLFIATKIEILKKIYLNATKIRNMIIMISIIMNHMKKNGKKTKKL